MDLRGANMIESEMRDRLAAIRAELASTRLERDNMASLNSSLIAQLADANRIIESVAAEQYTREAELAARDARIAELETDHLFAENKRLREACQEFRARAERAEATLARTEESWAKDCASWRDDITRAERAEAEADSLRSTINNMREMNIKWTWEATGKGLAAEAELKAMREVLLSYIADYENPEQTCHNGYTYEKARAALAPSPAGREGRR